MKIIATITDVAAVIHAGGSPEAMSAIIDIPDDKIPAIVHQYVADKKRSLEESGFFCYSTLSFSVLDERAGDNK